MGDLSLQTVLTYSCIEKASERLSPASAYRVTQPSYQSARHGEQRRNRNSSTWFIRLSFRQLRSLFHCLSVYLDTYGRSSHASSNMMQSYIRKTANVKLMLAVERKITSFIDLLLCMFTYICQKHLKPYISMLRIPTTSNYIWLQVWLNQNLVKSSYSLFKPKQWNTTSGCI